MPNPVVHFEIVGPDGGRLQEFYSTVFGWAVNADNPLGYGLVDTGGEGINGAVAQDDRPHAMFYIQVDDPAAFLRTVQEHGGKVVRDVVAVPGGVTVAHFEDPAGNIIGLVGSDIPSFE